MLITVSGPGPAGPVTGVGLAGWLAGVGALGWLATGPQMKFAHVRGGLPGGGGCLGHCASIHCTRGSEPDGDTGSAKNRTYPSLMSDCRVASVGAGTLPR